MTVAQGCALLALAFVAGIGAGYALAEYMRELPPYETAETPEELETLFRKGGPPTPEAMTPTETPDTGDN